MARGKRWGARHMAWVRSFSKRKRRHNPRRRRYHARSHYRARRRRNPFPIGGFLTNRRRRRRRHNPVLGIGSLPPLQSVLYVGVGLAGTPIAEGFINSFLPVSITANTFGKYAVRIGTVILLSTLGRMALGRRQGNLIAIGGGAYVLVSAVKEFAPGVIPGLSAYVPPPGMRAYVTGGPTVPAIRTQGLGATFRPSTSGIAAISSGNVTAARFRRW